MRRSFVYVDSCSGSSGWWADGIGSFLWVIIYAYIEGRPRGRAGG